MHTDSLQQTNGWEVSGICDPEDPPSICQLEHECDGPAYGGGGNAASLRLTFQCDPDLGLLAIRGEKQTDVTDEAQALRVGDANLGPHTWLK